MTRKKITKTITSCLFALAMPVLCLSMAQPVQKNTNADSSVQTHYEEEFSITNGSFDSISSTYSSNNVSGWSLVNSNTGATTMIIDVEKDYEENYSSQTYALAGLSKQPGKKDSDSKILMINSTNRDNLASSSSFVPNAKNEGYKSSDLTLSANSYYYFQVSFKTLSFNSEKGSPFASIYLSGLQDENGNTLDIEYERLYADEWQTAYIYVATGAVEQTVNLELWLGTKDGLTSSGAVFFDAVYAKKYSQNYFYENYYAEHFDSTNYYLNPEKTNTDLNGNTYTFYGQNENYVSGTRNFNSLCELDESVMTSTDINLDFEKDNSSKLDTLVDWTLSSHQNADARVIDITSKDIFESVVGKNYNYTGTNFKYNNQKALVLWTKNGEKGSISLSSKDISVKAHETLKITALVKASSIVSGSFEFKVKENNTIFTDFPELEEYYTLNEKAVTVSSTSSNSFKNDYQEVSIYLQGHDLYDSSFNIFLSLADETEGCVVVDNISVEKINYETYDNGSEKLKLNFSQDQMSASIPNGFFDSAYSTEKTTSYPLSAEGWTLSQKEGATGIYSGVVNTYEKYFNEFKASNDYASSFSNPAKDKTDSNNIFMLYNGVKSYQSIKSTSFSLSEEYSKITLSLFTQNKNITNKANVTIDIYTDEDVLIFTETLTTSSNWKDDYSAYIKKGENATSCYIVISLGKENAESEGIAYIDNVKLVKSNEEDFNNAVKKSDLSNFLLNLDPTNSINSNITSPLGYTLATTATGNSTGGIIIGKGNDSYGHIKNDGISVSSIDDDSLTTNVLVLNTREANTVSLTSKFNISLSADTYYKLKFRVLTSIPAKVENPDDESVNNYGVSIGLENMTFAENLEFNDGWTECSFYFYNADSSSLSTNLVFSLTALSLDTTGYAYLTDISWEEDDETFESAFANAENLDGYGKTIFTAKYDTSTDEEEDTDTDDTTTDSENSTNLFTIFASIASGITGLALIIAFVGIILKNIKIKKVEKVRNEEYDRKITIDKQVVIDKANQIKKEEQQEIENKMNKITLEMKTLEDKQKENIALSRQNNGNITREIEKEFKSYAGKHAKLQDKLNMLNEELENINSAEYMISLQKKITSQITKEKRESLKQAKAESKNKK